MTLLKKYAMEQLAHLVISKRNSFDEEIERCVFSFPRRKKIIEEDEDEGKEVQRREFDEDAPHKKEG